MLLHVLRFSQTLILSIFLRICTGQYYLLGTIFSNTFSSSDSTTPTVTSTQTSTNKESRMSSSSAASTSTSEVSSVTRMSNSFTTLTTVTLTQPLTSVKNFVTESPPIYSTNAVMNFTDLPPIQEKDVAPGSKSFVYGLGIGIALPVLGFVMLAISCYIRRRSLNEENASLGKTNVTKVQSNNKSVVKELVIIKKIPKIHRSQTPDNIYYNIEMEDKRQKNCSTSTEEYYNVAIKPKDGLNNHSIHRPDGTAESQYASLDISTNSEHLYTGFKI